MANEVKIKLTDAQKEKIREATGKDLPEIRVESFGSNPAASPSGTNSSSSVLTARRATKAVLARKITARRATKAVLARKITARRATKAVLARKITARRATKAVLARKITARRATRKAF
jgi:hypothetical protein